MRELDPDRQPLPVSDELLECLTLGTTLQDQGPVKTVRIVYSGRDAVVRFGPQAHLGEVYAMDFVRQHTPAGSIPLAPLLGLFISKDAPSNTDKPILYIVTEWIQDSQTLHAIWPSLEEHEKDGVTMQLRAILHTLRSLEPPSSSVYIGAVGGGACSDLLLNGAGPFDTIDDFIQSYVDIAKPCFRGHYISIIERLLHKTKSYRIVLTHGDLALSNILVRKNLETGSWKIVALVDWENSGWYPEHWEYLKLLGSVKWKSDWALHAQNLLDRQYDEDFLLDNRLRLFHRL
ncbi:hypothetical protein GGX14DRAFT_483585 [Mycena pura]|uniref:Aminoglycoside phosphotransferase domain-containing protein n=1 Tax=Mycena pura TaxID=153505 RepID=A0AAD6XZU5_9AGAR|nr:hypothetical protein GGX14DRAFT_483585 [Mycena pura]